MQKATRFLLVAISVVSMFWKPGWSFSQPPLNFGATSFLDGGGAPSGLYGVQYVQFINGEKAIGNDGNVIPGDAKLDVLVSLTQVYYLSKCKFLGAYVGFDSLIPVAAPTLQGNLGPIPLTNNTAGIGDLAIGPALQWNDTKIAGKIPFFHRAEVYVILPTGKYDQSKAANPGSNITTWEGYYSFTTFLSPKLETSWRFLYALNGENPDTHKKPGQLFHLNYAFSQEITSEWRLGISGYYLQQTTEDRDNNKKGNGTKERAYAAGPGVAYVGQGLTFMLTHPIEFGVRNRFEGSRTTLQLIHKF